MAKSKKAVEMKIEAETEQESVGVEASPIPVVVDNTPVVPKIGSSEWSNFILDQLNEDEKMDGYPTYFGIRRLFEQYIGEIYKVDMEVVQVAEVHNLNRATVLCNITYVGRQDNVVRTISDVADASDANVKSPFCLFTTATAATMAESRALRKGLRIRTIAAEENQRDSISDAIREVSMSSSKITENQKLVIDKLCQKLGIDVAKLLANLSLNVPLNELSNEDGQKVLRALNSYERGPDNKGEIIPDAIMKD